MIWTEIRNVYPEQWLVVEAIEAHSTADHYRIPDQLSVIEKCADGSAAMTKYRQFHKKFPLREFYFVHTAKEELKILERKWVGIQQYHEITSNQKLRREIKKYSSQLEKTNISKRFT